MASARKARATLVEATRAPDPNRGRRVLTEPSVRISTQWTPSRVRTCQQSADGGNMLMVADLCDQMLRDDRFGEALQALADGVLGSELTWEKGLRARRKRPLLDKVPLEAEADNDWWIHFHEAEFSQILVWRELIGFCWAQLTWLIDDRTGRWVPRITFWHPRHFRYDNHRKQWIVRVDEANTELDVNAGDGWVVFYRRSVNRPWADGQWRGLARWWILKGMAISDWGVHSEKAARQVVTADEGVGQQERNELANDLYQLSKDGVISLPHGVTYQLVEASANTRDIYQAQIDAANMAATVAILGQNLTTEISDNGSRAASETHERKENRKIRYIAESLSTTLREQVMLAWAGYNFGAEAIAPWHVWQVAPADDLAGKAAVLQSLASAVSTFKAAGKAVPEDKLRDDYGLELEDLPSADAGTAAVTGKPAESTNKPAEPAKT